MYNLYQICIINERCQAESIGIAADSHALPVEREVERIIQDRYAFFVRCIVGQVTPRKYGPILLPHWRDRLQHKELVK